MSKYVHQTGQELGVEMPILEANMKGIFTLGGFYDSTYCQMHLLKKRKTGAVVESCMLVAITKKWQHEELVAQYPDNHLVIPAGYGFEYTRSSSTLCGLGRRMK